MSILDLNKIFMAADSISGKQGNSYDPQGKQACFQHITYKKQDVSCCFVALETRETGFVERADASSRGYFENRNNDPIPPYPPETGFNREIAAGSAIPVSFVSHERDTQYLCSVQDDQSGKHPCFPLFPVFPEDAEVPQEFEHLFERAAIREYDGGMGREEAEAEALKDYMLHCNTGGPYVVGFHAGIKTPGLSLVTRCL